MQPRRREVLHYVSHGKDVFGGWLDGLKDIAGRAAILKRIDRVEDGKFGGHRAVGEGVWELRVHHGPGYRVYYGEDGPKIVLLLCGGDKARQHADVRRAQELRAEHRRLKMNRTVSHHDYLMKHLADPKEASAYLNAVAEDGNLKALLKGVRNVVEARGGVGSLSKRTRLSRTTLYKTLSDVGNPAVGTLETILAVYGIRIGFFPMTHASAR